MFVAEKLRAKNIAEYLLYMWQVEDLIRAFSLDIDKLEMGYLSRFDSLDAKQQKDLRQWYADIIEMMRSEGVAEKGHLQICRNVLINLSDLHDRLMVSQKYPYYHAAYHKALPLIVELRAKQDKGKEHTELESCFECLYGVMLLKMQGRELSNDTAKAVETISTFLGSLSDYYIKDRMEPLEF